MKTEKHKKKRRRKHSKTKYYILAALSYLINSFATGLVFTETGKTQLKKYSYFFVSQKFLPVYVFIATVLMIIFYYKRYISRHHFHKKNKVSGMDLCFNTYYLPILLYFLAKQYVIPAIPFIYAFCRRFIPDVKPCKVIGNPYRRIYCNGC